MHSSDYETSRIVASRGGSNPYTTEHGLWGGIYTREHGEDEQPSANPNEGLFARWAAGPYEVAWDGDRDPTCPMNMSSLRKWSIMAIVCTGTICVTCTSSIYTTTYSQMDVEFGISSPVSAAGLSVFVFGIALGPSITSPLSEFYGRRPIYLASWCLFVIWGIIPAVAKNIETMIMVRFFGGFCGSSFLSVAGGTVADLFSPDEIQAPMVLVSLGPFVGPSLGPVLGGFINYYLHWRWTYYFLISWSVIILVSVTFFVPETFHPVLLRDKARKLRAESGDERYQAPVEKSSRSIGKAIGLSLLRPFQLLVLEQMCRCLTVYSATLLGILHAFFTTFPLVFRTTYGITLWQCGLAFLGIVIGMCVAALSNPIWTRTRTYLVGRQKQHTGEAVSQPEYQLPPAILGAVFIPIGLFWFGWTLSPSFHWMIPILGSSVFGCGTVLVYTGVFTFLVDAYPGSSRREKTPFSTFLAIAEHPRMAASLPTLGHVSIGVKDIGVSKAFYSAILAPLDLRLVYESHPQASDASETSSTKARVLGYGPDEDHELINIFEYPGDAHAPGRGFHLAFNAPNRQAVEAFHAAAIKNGGTCDGAPGLREWYGPNYFAAFVVDPEGWRLEAVCKNSEGAA
ncbi:hypothetical protein ACJZ2D_000376 [Fusarium nematophilum]